MKKLLLITYMFPPIAGGGIQRTLKFIKYLPHYNLAPVVFCPQKAFWKAMDYMNLELPYVKETKVYRYGINRLKKYFDLRYNKNFSKHPYFYLLGIKYLWFMDFFSSWYFECRDNALKIAEKENVDYILTSSPPHSVHLFGNYLKEKLRIPWLMDLRDAMFNEPNIDFSRMSGWIQAHIEGYYEKKFYRNADAIISVSQPILDSICNRHPLLDCERKTNLVMNGFDDEDFIEIENRNKRDKLIITYTGSFLGRRTPEHFLKALTKLSISKEIDARDILIRFIGHFESNVLSIINNYINLLDIDVIGYQPYDKALAYQTDSDMLLLINSVEKEQRGNQILTGKVFEYLGAQRPIFALTPDGPLKEIITKGRFGSVVSPTDINSIADKFKEQYLNWKTRGALCFKPDISYRDTFTRKKLAEKLASIILSF